MRSLKELVDAKPGPALGTFVKIPAPELAEIIADAGFDLVIIDSEHALLSVRDIYTLVVTYSNAGVLPLVRVTDHNYGDAQRILDAGAAGILVPHVSDAPTAATVMRPLTFPPLGTRGMGFASRAGRWGALEGGVGEYLRRGDDIARVAMVEEESAIANVDAIVAEPLVDAVFIGPGDLSLSMGPGVSKDAVERAVETAVGDVKRGGKLAGTTAGNAAKAERLTALGVDFLLVGNDTGMFSRAARRELSEIRDRVLPAAKVSS